MNKIIENIKARRSCRSFKPENINKQEIELIIQAGIWAPSGNNKQPWYFTVIRDRKKIKAISDRSKENAKKYLEDPRRLEVASNEKFDLFYGAFELIIVSGDPKSSTMTADCSAAIQNMLLAAHSMGIGSLWNGIIKRFWFDTPGVNEFKKDYEIPDDYQPLFAVAFGYPDKNTRSGPDRKNNVINYI